MSRRIRVLVGKPGLDGHDRGAKVVAAALRDAGMEVIYTGLHQTPEQIVEAALQEDVDVVALSILSGAHMTLFPEVMTLMKDCGIADKLLTGGGIIPAEDMENLARMGVGRLFGPGASTQDIAQYIHVWFRERHGEAALTSVPSRPAAYPARTPEAKPAAAKPAPRPAASSTRRPTKVAMARAGARSGRAKSASALRAKPARSPRAARAKTARTSARPAAGRSARRPAAAGRGTRRPASASRKSAARRGR